jgi:hypothetical protein
MFVKVKRRALPEKVGLFFLHPTRVLKKITRIP